MRMSESTTETVFPDCPVIEIGQGEKIKTLDTVRDIFDRLVALEADRSFMIVGIGGGIVCDIAGFIASTYLRGVRFGFVSTTLLSQVDASRRGRKRTALIFPAIKTWWGFLISRRLFICDPDMLKTLPPRELGCGFAEIVKHGVIADFPGFAYLEDHANEALGLDADVIERLVYDSVVVKSEIVNRDEREKGERRKLNFGHTFWTCRGKKLHRFPTAKRSASAWWWPPGCPEQRCGLDASAVSRLIQLLERLHLPIRLECLSRPGAGCNEAG